MRKGFEEAEAKMCMMAAFNADRDKKGVWYHATDDPGDYAFIQKNSDGSYVLAFHGTDFSSKANVAQVSEIYKWVAPSFSVNSVLKPKISVAVDSAFLDFQASLSLFLDSLESGVDFYVTGHSEGGAIASIITLFIASNFEGKFNIKTYAFAPPTAGNTDFKELVEAASPYGFYRVVNPNDIVPHFNDAILEVLKKELPVKIPFLIKLVYFSRYLLLKLLRLDYVRIGETHTLPDKTFSSCLTSPDLKVQTCNSKNTITNYICYTRCAHYPTTYLDLMGVPVSEITDEGMGT